MSNRDCLRLQLLELEDLVDAGNGKMRVSRFAQIFGSMAAILNVYAADALAQSPDPSPTPTMPPDPPPVTNGGIWESFNGFLIAIMDPVLDVWPSTPEELKLATIVDNAHAAAPLGPWSLIGPAVLGAVWLLVVVGIAKAWKLVKW